MNTLGGRPKSVKSFPDIPLKPLLKIEGTLNGIPVVILKDDGCNTNVISKRFVRENRKKLKFKEIRTMISHSKEGLDEISRECVFNATVRIGSHCYTSNWIVGDCRYDLLLGMPWHVTCQPKVDYKNREIYVGDEKIRSPIRNDDEGISVTSIGVKEFRKKIRKGGAHLQLFQLRIRKREETEEKDERSGMVSVENESLSNILKKFDSVFKSELPSGLPPSRGTEHTIEVDEGGRPPYRRLYQLSPAELVAAKEYVEKLLRTGKIRPSASPYGAPLFFVKEKNGSLRGVVDYRALNRITKRNRAPIPRTDEMFDQLGSARYFSKLDLKTGFHQIRIRSEDIEKTAFNCKYGQFEYLVMPMGLCNAPATFQGLMNTIFRDLLDDFLVVYLDDLLIFSKTEEEHLEHIQQVLERLEENQLYVSPKKCSFLCKQVEFLGLIIGERGIEVDPRKSAAINEWTKPSTIGDVRSFIGLVQFFRRFVRNFSGRARPLTDLTKKSMGIRRWDSECDTAFKDLKKAISTAPVLVPPDWTKPFRLHVDASSFAIGGTLTQIQGHSTEQVIAYTSRKLNDAEKSYTANEREVLALVEGLKRFRCYLEGVEFEVFTDNQVVSNFFSKPRINRREARWLEVLANFNISAMNLKPGKLHILGDALSRIPDMAILGNLETHGDIIDGEMFSGDWEDYESDQLFGPIYRALNGEFPEDEKKKRRINILLPAFTKKGNKLIYGGKSCVPRNSIRDILFLAHDGKLAGHFGVSKTLHRLDNFHWRGKPEMSENTAKVAWCAKRTRTAGDKH